MSQMQFNEDRERAQEALTRAVGEGRLDLGEFTDLVGVVWATDDKTTLDRIIAEATPQAPPPATQHLAGTPAATPFAPHPVVPEASQQLSSFLGDVTRKGEWLVPERLSVRAILGDTYLDLRRATAASPVVTLHLDTFLGDIRIVVPPGVYVDVQVNSILGDSKVDTSEALPGAPRVVLTGTCILGDVKVTTKEVDDKPSFWWRWL
ncbi:DUF1707 SHOCT-like domain-containing protein [Corynebacterium halotolerans]|nr:LiaF domain-containing protein [Corynebacterium halotolerans]